MTMKKWKMPDHYAGAEWPEYYVFLGQNRDADTLTRSNFQCGLAAIGGESETVIVVREGHWAVGWVEWIAIHESDTDAINKANEILDALDDYPVIDELHWSELEDDEANQVWSQCFSDKERLDYIRENRSQFNFWSMSDLMAVARGRYFTGYASELLA